MNLFLVTSAINSRFGVFNPEERMKDTLKTVQSIKERAPDQPILLLEMCADKLTSEQTTLVKEHVTGLVEFAHFPDVQEIYKNDNWDIVKNLTEMLCCHRFFRHIQTNNIFPDVKRVFKVSGRYYLNNDFKIANYDTETKFVFAKRRQSQFDVHVTGNNPEDNYQYMSRLWSFPRYELPTVTANYALMINGMIDRLNNGGYIDIEHLLYRQFSKMDNVLERDIVGLEGQIAPNGQQVRD